MNTAKAEIWQFAKTPSFLVIWGAALFTFAAFIITALSWGGTALNGEIEDGRFYLGGAGEFREAGRARYAASAAWSMIWPPVLVLGVSRLRRGFPQSPDMKKLFVVLIVCFSLGASVFSIASLLCLMRALF